MRRSSLLIGSLGFIGAQSSQGASAQTQSETQDAPQTQRGYGFGGGFGRGFGGGFGHGFGGGSGSGNDFGRGFGGLPFGRPLALGTTVTLEFYTADPAGNEATPEQTLTFTYGEDSEATFAESFAEARANASYVIANVGEQTQTLELPSADENRWGGLRGASLPRGLSEGGTVEAVFYDGDPAGDAQTLETLTFTYAQDSEAGFAADFADAAETAAYVTVTTSPQTYMVDLSAVAEGRDFRQHRGGHRRYRHPHPLDPNGTQRYAVSQFPFRFRVGVAHVRKPHNNHPNIVHTRAGRAASIGSMRSTHRKLSFGYLEVYRNLSQRVR